jgi:hypothetical protein
MPADRMRLVFILLTIFSRRECLPTRNLAWRVRWMTSLPTSCGFPYLFLYTEEIPGQILQIV